MRGGEGEVGRRCVGKDEMFHVKHWTLGVGCECVGCGVWSENPGEDGAEEWRSTMRCFT